MSTESTTENPNVLDDKLEAAFQELEQDGGSATEKKSGNWIGVIGIMLGLIAIGIASYSAYELHRSKDTSVAHLAADDLVPLRTEQVRMQQLIEARHAQFTELQTTLNDQGIDIGAFKDQTKARLAELEVLVTEQDTAKPRDYVVAEVEYLVRMANQRLLMERDPASALSLLQSADEIVRDAEGLTAHRVREAFAQDIIRLKAVPKLDRQGTYLALSALIRQVPALEQPEPVYQNAASDTNVPGEMSRAPVTFLEKLIALAAKAFNRLTGLIDFRRDVVAVQPILPPKEAYFLRQNLILKLQIAQMALLDANQAVYADALTEARQWTTDGFDPDSAVTVSMIAELDALAKHEVATELPDISRSLSEVRSVLRQGLVE